MKKKLFKMCVFGLPYSLAVLVTLLCSVVWRVLFLPVSLLLSLAFFCARLSRGRYMDALEAFDEFNPKLDRLWE